MDNGRWSLMSSHKLGKCAEYLAMITFMQYGYNVYTPSVDDKGIDFIAEKGDKLYFVQVKSISDNNYMFVKQKYFKAEKNYLLSYFRFVNGKEPEMFIIPGTAFVDCKPPLTRYNYEKEGQKSDPEYGINLSKKNIALLRENFTVDTFFGR